MHVRVPVTGTVAEVRPGGYATLRFVAPDYAPKAARRSHTLANFNPWSSRHNDFPSESLHGGERVAFVASWRTDKRNPKGKGEVIWDANNVVVIREDKDKDKNKDKDDGENKDMASPSGASGSSGFGGSVNDPMDVEEEEQRADNLDDDHARILLALRWHRERLRLQSSRHSGAREALARLISVSTPMSTAADEEAADAVVGEEDADEMVDWSAYRGKK